MRSLWLGAAVSITTLSAASLHAKPISVVVRGIGAGSDKAAGFVQHFVREALKESDGHEVVDLAEALGSPTQNRAKRAFSVAEEMVVKGRSAYETLDLDPAIDFLNTALTKYERHAAYIESPAKVAEVLMLLGATHILRGEEKTGAKRLAQAVAVYPEIEPDPRIFNPGMRQIFQDAVDRLAARPVGTLSITSNPSYARVYVDGKFVGVTPMAIDKVTEGRHLVRLTKDGYRNWGRVIDVVGQVESTDVATMKPTDNFEEFDALVEAAMPSLPNLSIGDGAKLVHRQLGDLLDVDELFMAEVRLDGERVRVLAVLLDLTKKAVVNRGTQVFSYDSRPKTYRAEVAELLRSSFGDHGGDDDDDDDDDDDGGLITAASGECYGMPCQKFKNLMLAVGGGGGALLGLLGGLLDYLAFVDHSNYEKTAQRSPEAESLKKSGITKSILGDVFVVLGVATAITAVTLYFVWDPSPSAEEVVDQSGASWGWAIVPLTDGAAFSAHIEF